MRPGRSDLAIGLGDGTRGPRATEHSTAVAPGSNARGDLSTADWRFLLPRLRYDVMVYLGTPGPALMRVLAGMARLAIILPPDPDARRRVAAHIRDCDIADVVTLAADPAAPPLDDGTVDLLVAEHGPGLSRMIRAPGWIAHLDRLLSDDGVILLETAGVFDVARIREILIDRTRRRFAEPAELLAVRRKGMLRLAIPPRNDAVSRFCLDELVSGISRTGRRLRQVARLLARLGLLERVGTRRLVLLERDTIDARPSRIAPYLIDAAHDAGIRLDERAVAFYARADFNSNKVTLLGFDDAGRPRVIAKMTRSPVYNARLEREYRTLSTLQSSACMDEGCYPAPLFLRQYGELALIGQAVLRGSPFRNASTGRADCLHARAAIDLLTRLGVASADERMPADRVADQLEGMVARFARLYPAASEENDFLDELVQRLRTCDLDMPLVFKHGDPTTWNIVVREDGRVALLDWEHGDPRGLPLWDLLDFLQSYGGWASRMHGPGESPEARAAAFLEPGRMNALFARAIRDYCTHVGIDRSLIEPLFYTCWVDRALRSISSGTAPRPTAPFFRLLNLCIRGRRATGLARILDMSRP